MSKCVGNCPQRPYEHDAELITNGSRLTTNFLDRFWASGSVKHEIWGFWIGQWDFFICQRHRDSYIFVQHRIIQLKRHRHYELMSRKLAGMAPRTNTEKRTVKSRLVINIFNRFWTNFGQPGLLHTKFEDLRLIGRRGLFNKGAGILSILNGIKLFNQNASFLKIYCFCLWFEICSKRLMGLI